MQTEVDPDEPDLRGYLEVLRRHKWIVLGVVVATAAVALGLSVAQTPLYRSTAEVLVESGTPQQLFDPVTGDYRDPVRIMQNEIEFIASDAVTAAVEGEMDNPATVTVTAREDADIIAISATSDDAELAADTANTYAEVYLRERRQQSVQDYQESAAVVNAQLQQLNNQLAGITSNLEAIALQLLAPTPDTPVGDLSEQQARLEERQAAVEQERTDLQATARQLELTAQLLREGTATITQEATVSSEPYSPQPLRNVLLAVVVGLILGVGLAFLREYLDDSVRTKEDIERATGLSVLALLPSVGSWKNSSDTHLITVEAPKSPPAEAYRSLRTAIQFMGIDDPLPVVAITSSRSGEGKTTTTANLAIVLAQAGQRVLAMDCDLRKPRLHQFFGLTNSRGFTTALVDGSLDGALHELPTYGRLAVMPSGVVPPDPAELLASTRTDALFEKLLPHFDVIVVDSPPVLPVTDALVLSRMADAVILVTSARKTSKRDVHRSVELLGQVEAPVIGAVLNDVSSEAAYGYGYGAYGYTYGASADGGPSDSRRARRKAKKAAKRGKPLGGASLPASKPPAELPLSP